MSTTQHTNMTTEELHQEILNVALRFYIGKYLSERSEANIFLLEPRPSMCNILLRFANTIALDFPSSMHDQITCVELPAIRIDINRLLSVYQYEYLCDVLWPFTPWHKATNEVRDTVTTQCIAIYSQWGDRETLLAEFIKDNEEIHKQTKWKYFIKVCKKFLQ